MTVQTRNTTIVHPDLNCGKHGLFTFQTCGLCGVTFGAPSAFDDLRREDHKSFYCPNGHSWSYSGENREDKLRRERDEAQRRLATERDHSARLAAERDQVQASLTATKGVVTKQRKKLTHVANGVCPDCHRSFADLKAHIASKHPEITGAR